MSPLLQKRAAAKARQVARSYKLNDADADDLAQEGLIAAWEAGGEDAEWPKVALQAESAMVRYVHRVLRRPMRGLPRGAEITLVSFDPERDTRPSPEPFDLLWHGEAAAYRETLLAA